MGDLIGERYQWFQREILERRSPKGWRGDPKREGWKGVLKGRAEKGIPKGDDPATRQCDPLWETKGMTIDENNGGDQKVRLDAAITASYFYSLGCTFWRAIFCDYLTKFLC